MIPSPAKRREIRKSDGCPINKARQHKAKNTSKVFGCVFSLSFHARERQKEVC
jgi:hypothetical protein